MHVDAMLHTISSIGHLMDDPLEPSRMMDALAHMRWDIESVLESLPTLPVTKDPDIPSPTFHNHSDIPSTSMPAYDFLSISNPIHPSDVLSTSEVQFDIPSTSIPPFYIPSTLKVPYFDIPIMPIPPSDIPSTLEVRRNDVVYRRRRRR